MPDYDGITINSQGQSITSVVWQELDGKEVGGVLVEWLACNERHLAVREHDVAGPVVFTTADYPELCNGLSQPLRSPGMREVGRQVLSTLAYHNGDRVFGSWFD